MSQLPKDPKKIAERIRNYESALHKEFKRYGAIDDSAGSRYLLGALYLKLGDVSGALKSYKWLEKVNPDDSGEPFDTLCWTLTLYRSGDIEAASRKLLQTMQQNLYLLPALFGEEQERLDIWHGSSDAEKIYIQYAPPDVFTFWDEAALQWAKQTYGSPRFQEVRTRYIEIHRQLKSEPVGPKRSQLVNEMVRLRTFKDSEGDNTNG